MSLSLHFMNQTARILRANFAVDVTTIRDRIITDYGTVVEDVPIYLEPQGSDAVFHEQLGVTGLDSWTAYVPGGTPIQVNDCVLVDGVTYEARGVKDFTRHAGHMTIDLVRKNYHREIAP